MKLYRYIVEFYESCTFNPSKVQAPGTLVIFYIMWGIVSVLAGLVIGELLLKYSAVHYVICIRDCSGNPFCCPKCLL